MTGAVVDFSGSSGLASASGGAGGRGEVGSPLGGAVLSSLSDAVSRAMNATRIGPPLPGPMPGPPLAAMRMVAARHANNK